MTKKRYEIGKVEYDEGKWQVILSDDGTGYSCGKQIDADMLSMLAKICKKLKIKV